MQNMRKRIRQILNEIFDNIEKMPEGLKKEFVGNKIYYKFYYNDLQYAVEIIKIDDIGDTQMPNKKLKEFILSKANGFVFSFGTIEGGIYHDAIDTNKHEAVKVISFVSAIIKQFIKENNVNVVTFHAENTRNSIYHFIYNKYLKQDFDYYTAKETPLYNRFYIRKDFYDEFKNTNDEKEKL